MLGLGGLGLAGATAALASGQWFLECSDSAGNRLGGIDCFAHDSTPHTQTAPAEWLGFYGWTVVWVVCALAVAAAVIRLRRARQTA